MGGGMSTQDDINVLGDLIASEGTEDDKRAWARLKADMDRHRELMRLTDPEECRRLRQERDEARAELVRLRAGRPAPAAIVRMEGAKEVFHAFADREAASRFFYDHDRADEFIRIDEWHWHAARPADA